MNHTIMKALRGEAVRLEAAGSRRLELARRRSQAKTVTISSRLESVLLEELRAKAALAILGGAEDVTISTTIHGQSLRGMTVYVDPLQFEDINMTGQQRRAPDLPSSRFGSFS